MKRYLPVILTIVVVAVPAFLLAPLIWPPAPADAPPTAAQLASLAG